MWYFLKCGVFNLKGAVGQRHKRLILLPGIGSRWGAGWGCSWFGAGCLYLFVTNATKWMAFCCVGRMAALGRLSPGGTSSGDIKKPEHAKCSGFSNERPSHGQKEDRAPRPRLVHLEYHRDLVLSTPKVLFIGLNHPGAVFRCPTNKSSYRPGKRPHQWINRSVFR